MKNLIVMSLITLTMVGCVKTSSKKVDVSLPEIQKPKVLKLTKSGYKCDMVGEEDNKEIFIKLDKKEEKTTVSFNNFTSASKITIVGANFGDYNLYSFVMNQNSEDESILEGEGALTHADKYQLNDEGKVLSIQGRLILNDDLSGSLQQKLTMMMDDHTMKNTEYQEIARIENCEQFEADAF